MKRSVIKGTGRYIPPRLVTNADLTQWMDTTDDWIVQRTGIEQRYWVSEEGNTGASDLALEAAKIAMERAQWTHDDVDMIILGTLSPDINFPGSACLLQDKLGLGPVPSLDIRQQCTGFIYGLATADAYIKAGLANRILVVGTEVHSTGLDISTRGRDVAVIFGDGAAVACVEGVDTNENVGVMASALHADGKHADLLMLEAPASRLPERLTHEMLDEGRHYPIMNGSAVFKQAVRRLPEVTYEVLEKAALSIEDIKLIIPHQANLRINQMYQKTLKLPDGIVFNNIQKYGNTTAASIPIALDEALEKGLIGKSGDTILFVGFGAGLTWGGVVYRFP
ncbi:MAG: 3-oxoacyl-ACP synthase [Deltaproteobacteria bacterium]|nr:MAG: 3-oxoacyl-ACP synthase [Deltaproteobacteria bacterium]